MPLKRTSTSPAVLQALVVGLLDFTGPGDPIPLSSLPIERWLGLNVFSIQIQDLLKSAGLDAAAPAGWRFLTRAPPHMSRIGPGNGKRLGDDLPASNAEEDSGAVAADIVETSAEGPPEMVALLRDPLIDRAIQAVEEIENLPQLQEQDYELRVLRIPGILIEAFWLVSQGSEPDLLVPVLTGAPELKRMQPYTADEFLTIASSLASGYLEFDQIPADKVEPQNLG